MDHNGAIRYSTAIFEIAKKNNKIDEYMDEMKEVSIVFRENREIMEVLNHPNIGIGDKKHIIEQAFKDNIDPEIISLINILLARGKIDEFINVSLNYKDLVYRYKGIKVAHVTTAVGMTDDEIDMLRGILSAKYECTIEIKNKIDPDIVGGVYLRVGNEVTDGTIRGNFEKMKKELLNSIER